MDTRIALIGIILETRESVDELNHLLSEYGEYVIGRMGIPYREKASTSSVWRWMLRITSSALCPADWGCCRA